MLKGRAQQQRDQTTSDVLWLSAGVWGEVGGITLSYIVYTTSCRTTSVTSYDFSD